MSIDFLKVVEFAGNLSSISLLIIAIIGGFKGWYVWRWTYDAHIGSLDKQVNEWKTIALQGLKLTKAVIETSGSQ